MIGTGGATHARFWRTERATQRAARYWDSLDNLMLRLQVQGYKQTDPFFLEIRADRARVEYALSILGYLN